MVCWSRKWLLAAIALLLGCFQSHAGAVLIKEVPSVRGRMQLVENEQLNSFLVFPQEQRQLILNSAWRNTNIEYLTQVGDQTVVVMAYSEALCSSRQALVVVTPRGVWGPYQLGGCEDTLIYQRSEAKDSFVALNPMDAMAWVYTANDEKFRGPARIDLPEQLRQFVPNSSSPPVSTPTPPTIASPPVTSPAPQPPQKDIQSPSTASVPSAPPTSEPSQKSVQSPSNVSIRSVPPASEPPFIKSATAPTQKQSPAPNRSPKFSSTDASIVAEKVAKTTKPQRQVVIDLM
jgi:hypothetical protein